MNLLMVSAYLPGLSSAAGERGYYFLRALARQHTVSLLSMIGSNEVKAHGGISPVKDLADSVQLIPHEPPHSKRRQQLLNLACGSSYLLNQFDLQEVQAALDKILSSDHYDAVFFESVLMAG